MSSLGGGVCTCVSSFMPRTRDTAESCREPGPAGNPWRGYSRDRVGGGARVPRRPASGRAHPSRRDAFGPGHRSALIPPRGQAGSGVGGRLPARRRPEPKASRDGRSSSRLARRPPESVPRDGARSFTRNHRQAAVGMRRRVPARPAKGRRGPPTSRCGSRQPTFGPLTKPCSFREREASFASFFPQRKSTCAQYA